MKACRALDPADQTPEVRVHGAQTSSFLKTSGFTPTVSPDIPYQPDFPLPRCSGIYQRVGSFILFWIDISPPTPSALSNYQLTSSSQIGLPVRKISYDSALVGFSNFPVVNYWASGFGATPEFRGTMLVDMDATNKTILRAPSATGQFQFLTIMGMYLAGD